MEKRFKCDRKPSAKGWEKFFEILATWTMQGFFNDWKDAIFQYSRAVSFVIPNSTSVITITKETYILKNFKNEIQGVVVGRLMNGWLYGGFEE